MHFFYSIHHTIALHNIYNTIANQSYNIAYKSQTKLISFVIAYNSKANNITSIWFIGIFILFSESQQNLVEKNVYSFPICIKFILTLIKIIFKSIHRIGMKASVLHQLLLAINDMFLHFISKNEHLNCKFFVSIGFFSFEIFRTLLYSGMVL